MRHSLGLALLVWVAGIDLTTRSLTASAEDFPGLAYTNSRIASVPWSIHVVHLDWANPRYQVQSIHAHHAAVGLDTLSDQLSLVNPAEGTAVAAINGDFYQRDSPYAGAARGLQIVEGKLISGPSGVPSFWINGLGEFHLDKVESQFQITWPDGTFTAFGLNGERRDGGVELYTQEIGTSTHTSGGRELILERIKADSWLPLHIGHAYTARVRKIRETGDTPLASNIMVLSLGPAFLHQSLLQIQTGAVLYISTASRPALNEIKTAISGGPVLIRNGKRGEFRASPERQPRAAVGWNGTSFFLVEVDGRQRGLSVGMTLDELAKLMANLGCEEAMNLDGGGSATLWYDGQVRNNPCDRGERDIANCLVIVKK